MTQEERIKRMKEAGIPMPITQVIGENSISSIPITSQNADKHARLQALKSGANKQVVQTLVKAQGNQQQSFQGIPEVKQNRRPQGQSNQTTPVQTVAVESNFGPVAPISGELAAIEAMMGGGAAPSYNPQQHIEMTQTMQPQLSVDQDGYGPTFDPVGMLAKKRQQMQQNQYMQFAQQETVENALAPLQQQVSNPNLQQNFDFQNMQKMMEQIAKNTISDVLNSYTEKNKDKLTYERVNVKTNDGNQVIKTQDGKYYKLVPVKIRS